MPRWPGDRRPRQRTGQWEVLAVDLGNRSRDRWRSHLGLVEATLDGDHAELHIIDGAQFPTQRGQGGLDDCPGHVQLGADLWRGTTLQQESQHLVLARGERAGSGIRLLQPRQDLVRERKDVLSLDLLLTLGKGPDNCVAILIAWRQISRSRSGAALRVAAWSKTWR
jgi:hypothetical protein